ncbi:hypothetical protein Lal_00023547 [Lupinus albus]|nr:hypothetical protein Lal_00023547 [Lupinus albus]
MLVESIEQKLWKQEMAMDIVESIVSKIMPYAAGSAWSHIGYIIFYKNNVEKLDTQLQSLVAANDSLQQRVNAAIRNGEEIFINVKNSLEKANVSIGDANNFLVDEDHARVGCLNWPLTSLCRMHQLGKKSSDMVNTISEIKTQLNEALKMDTISSLPRLNVSLCPSTRGYEALQSRTLILNQIMQELKDDSLYMIGVHGMGGVGKTTLVEEVAWQAELDDCYGVVIKAIVSNSANVKGIQGQEEDVRQIQDQLADCLGLKFSEPSLQGRARRLRDKIIKEDKVLVIMDDLWRKIDLKEVGVPFGDQHKGCKLLLTSRDLNVLSKEMGTQQNFRLVTLSKEEGWNLFEKEVGNVVKQYHIQTIASEVAEACKGLPLLLVAVAKALKNEEHLYAWIDAFKQLTTHDDDGLSSITNKALDLSYKYLASDRHKSIFLLIGSFGQRFCHIEDLLMWVWGLGLFRKVDTLEDARNKLHKIIDDLKASSLILDKEGNYVTMHDVIREGAAKIASRDQPFFFLEEGLEILSLEYTDIEELPKEIGKLIHLRKLNLDNCTKLRLIPANLISSLTRLEELHMGNCFCIQWEVEGSKQCSNASLGELRHLDHLKSLHLQIGDISNMPRDLLIFGKLQRYKILVGHGWRQSWYSETSRTLKLKLSSTTTTSLDDGIKMLLGGVEDLSLAEVKGVRNVLPELTGEGFPLLKHLLVKNCVEILYIIDSTKCLLPPHSFLCLETLIIHDLINLEKICCGQFPKHIFTKLQKIEVVGCEQLKNIFSFSMARNLTKLFRIEISDCEFMRNVIVEQEEECEDNEQINFSKLLSITLMKLPNLVTFSSKKSNITKDSDNLSHPIALFDEKIAMPNLETLKVKSCHNFKYLFSSSLVKTLVKLEKLDIRDCCMMEHIFVQDEDEYLCKEKYEMQPILHNIETVKISECPMLMNIFPSSVLFQNLVDLWIHGCSGIVNIMTSSTARSLVNLSYLWISDCEMLEEIVECENDSDGIGEIAFMKLKKLILSNLPRLTRFCKENFIFKLPLLERLLVEKCPELEAFSPIIFYSAPKLTQVKSQMKFENWW